MYRSMSEQRRRRSKTPKRQPLWRKAGQWLRSPAALGALTVIVIAAFVALGFILADRVALRQALAQNDVAYMRDAYAERAFAPIWLKGAAARPAAKALVAAIEISDTNGLSPAAYDPALLRRRLAELSKADRATRMRTELMLSSAYTRYVRDLHTPSAQADLVYTDRDLKPAWRDPADIMKRLAGATSAQDGLIQATRMSALYGEMRQALARHRATAPADKATESLLLLNLDRLRALPGDDSRFVLVDAASSRLWLMENQKSVDTMKVIAGTPAQQTPQMAGVIRYAIFNPYWNVPPDLARDTYAPRILAQPSALNGLQMDAWSGFTAKAVLLNPSQVDWRAVAQGTAIAWLRQRPGGINAMGSVKFMLPNELGIYLHDTPERGLFDREGRHFSAGCVRVEDAVRFSRWLNQGLDVRPKGKAAEQRVDLEAPVPVYFLYLTAIPEPGGVKRWPDAYGRDPPALRAAEARALKAAA